jgi:GTPase SAR1 family protein
MSELPAKVVVVGDFAVGKTSLIGAFLRSPADRPCSTVGPSMTRRRVRAATGDEITVDLWDTAGQEQYQALTPAFVRCCDAVIVCYERGGEAAVERWVRIMRPDNPDAHFVGAVTKADTFEGDGDAAARVEAAARALAERHGLESVHLTSTVAGSAHRAGIAALFGAAVDAVSRARAPAAASAALRTVAPDAQTEGRACCQAQA